MKKYLVFLALASFTSAFPMDHSGLDKGKERALEATEHPGESFELTEDVWVETSDEAVIQIPAKIANELDMIKGFIQDGVVASKEELLYLEDIASSSLQSLLDLCNADGSVNEESLSEQELDKLVMLLETSDYLAYSEQETIINKLIEELLKPEGKDRFLSGELNLEKLSYHYDLNERLRERIERLSMISCLQKEPKLLSGHSAIIYSVCISPDNNYVITGSWDNTAKIWDITTGECKHTLSGHTRWITSVCVSPDSSYVITGSDDGTAKIWDITTGECKHTLSGHTDWITSVCVSPDGKNIITGSWDSTAKIWDITTGECKHTLCHTKSIYSVCVSPDGRYAITGSDDSTAKIWDITTGECKHTLSGHTRSIDSVCVSPDGRYAITGSYDSTAKIWDITTGECKHTLSGHTEEGSRSVCVSPDGRSVITGSYDRTAKIWDITTGECKHTLSGHTDYIYSVCVSPDGRSVITGSDDRTAKIWDITTGECKHTLSGHTEEGSRLVCVSPDGRSVITGSCGYTAKVWQTKDLELEATVRDSSLEQLLLVAYSLMYPEVDLTTDYAKTVLKSCPKNVRDFVNSNIPRKWLTYATLRNGLLVGAADVFGGYKLYQWYKGSE